MNNYDPKIASLAQWKKRVMAVKFIYQQLVRDESNDFWKQLLIDEWIDMGASFIEIIEYFLTNRQAIITELEKYIKTTWTFDRINLVDQAILICAYLEHLIIKTDKAIIIDEAVKTSKRYSDFDNHKYINAILDKVIS